MATFTLPPHYQTAFYNNWLEIMAQQSDHRLAGLYDEFQVNGNAMRFDQIGAQSYAMRQKSARTAASEPSDIPTFQRWLRPKPWDKTTWIDEDDHILLGQLADPTSPTASNHAIAINRLKDFLLIIGAIGTNYVGASGTTAVNLSAANQLAVNAGSGSANSGLQLFKLTQMSYLLDTADVPEEDRCLVYAAKQLNDLITNVDQVNNVLYNEVRALRDGRIRDFMGFKIVRTQLLPFVSGSSTLRTIFAFQKKFLVLGMGMDMSTKIDIIPEQSHTIQVRSKINLDVTRKEEAGVVTAICDETL